MPAGGQEERLPRPKPKMPRITEEVLPPLPGLSMRDAHSLWRLPLVRASADAPWHDVEGTRDTASDKGQGSRPELSPEVSHKRLPRDRFSGKPSQTKPGKDVSQIGLSKQKMDGLGGCPCPSSLSSPARLLGDRKAKRVWHSLEPV